jgi:N-methylhydantoinase A
MTTASALVAGVDVGGTFTDLVLFDATTGELGVAKVPSTPANQSEGVLDGLRAALPDLSRLERLVHGTTVSTNTMLQGNGASVAMVTSAGFRDVLEIGRTRRMLPSLYDTRFVRPAPLVGRPHRFEVAERLAADGTVLVPLDEAQVAAVAESIANTGAESVAVCFLHAYLDPAHELRATALLEARLPGVWVTASSQVVPEFREYERFSTTVINAYLLPVMDRYLASLSGRLAGAGYAGKVFTMASGGGIMDLATARRLPVRTILSGPAGGVAGSLWIGAAAGVRDFITCDMGGTSTDVCLIENLSASSVSETAFAGYPIKGREVAINTVGAGGGSIAHVEAGGQLRVGPRSAGALPGPACYGRGGREPTVTDANLVLGRLGARTLGGAIHPDAGLARSALQRLATALAIDSAEAMAEGILRIAVAQMASAIREISIERGYDPSGFVLLAFGGAGPMHATQVADELGMREVLIPLLPGNLSALGLLASDQRYERVRTHLMRLGTLEMPALRALLAAHEREGAADLLTRGFAAGRIRFEHALDMRYARQAFELTVDVPAQIGTVDELHRVFLDAYARHYGRADPDGEVEIVNLRTTSVGITDKPVVPPARGGGGDLAHARLGQRAMICNGVRLDARVYERDRLPVDTPFDGPAVIEEGGATTVLLPGWTATRDATGNLRLRRH